MLSFRPTFDDVYPVPLQEWHLWTELARSQRQVELEPQPWIDLKGLEVMFWTSWSFLILLSQSLEESDLTWCEGF